MISIVGKRVGSDVDLIDKHLAVVDSGVGVFQVDLAESDGFHLGSFKRPFRLRIYLR